MRLESFSVENYRSITKARRIPLSANTVLIGPNNEGKSNILRALSAAMHAIRTHQLATRKNLTDGSYAARKAGNPERVYKWDRDFPVTMQKKPAGRVTKVVLEFILDESEIAAFKEEIRSNLNGTLPVCVTFYELGIDVKIVKQGTGSSKLNSKSDRIAAFLARRIKFQYIPAVRTAKVASTIVEEIVAAELIALERDPEFRRSVEAIRALQKPILDGFSDKITETLKSFLPRINSVQFSVNDERRFNALRHDIDISVDDGNVTSLESKGDGIQSIVALGLRRHALEEQRRGSSYIFAIEEPEAHLHPDAIHELRSVISDLGGADQVVLTTHSPLLVNRNSLNSNIVVSNSKAQPARSISDIRIALGVRSYDNLVNAEVVLMVEGDDDKLAMRAILSDRSSTIAAALEEGRLTIEGLDGAGSLSAKAGLYKGILCSIHCFVDDDAAGRTAISKAKSAGVIDDGDFGLTIISGRIETEFEDLVQYSIYAGAVQARFGVDIRSVKARNKKAKWSGRMSDIFAQSGVPFDELVKMRLKLTVAQAVADNPTSALNPLFEPTIQTLVQGLEAKLSKS
jgi:predicted ATP-dependent endonuclease of OLD family